MRLYGLSGHFGVAYRLLRRRLRDERLRILRDEGLAELVAGGIALVLTAVALAFMGWQALLGFLTLGDLAMFYQAFNQGQGLMRSLLQNLSQVYTNSLFLGDLFTFLALEPRITTPPGALPAPKVLQTRDLLPRRHLLLSRQPPAGPARFRPGHLGRPDCRRGGPQRRR